MTLSHRPLHDANDDGIAKICGIAQADGCQLSAVPGCRRLKRLKAAPGYLDAFAAIAMMLLLLCNATSPSILAQAFLFPQSSSSNTPFSLSKFHHKGQHRQQLHQRSSRQNTLYSSSAMSISKDGDSAVNDETPDIDSGSIRGGSDDGYDGLGEYDPSEDIRPEREVVVGDPQIRLKEKERSVTSILKELAAIQQQGPQKYCILGTRHCSYLHQQIIELLAYALVLSGNHVFTSGAGGTNAATIRGALRAEREDLLTVVLPQSMDRQAKESQELLKKVKDVITMPQNDDKGLDVASRICNSYLLSQTDQLISFAFHESNTVIEATKEAKKLDMLVTVLYLD